MDIIKLSIVPIKMTKIITGIFPYFFKYLPEKTVKHDADKTPIIIKKSQVNLTL